MEKPKFPKRLPNFCEVLFNDTPDDNKIIFYSDDEPISYAKFKQLVKNFYKYLKDNKITSNDFAMILASDSYMVPVIVMSCFAMGTKTYCPSPSFSEQNIQGLIDKGNFKHIFCDEGGLTKSVHLKNVKVHIIEDIKNYIENNNNDEINFHTFADDEIALFFNTTGSTGLPKLVPHSMNNVYEYAKVWSNALEIESNDVIFCIPKICFNYGQGISLLANIFKKSTAILLRNKPSPRKIETVLNKYKPTYFFVVPQIANMMCIRKLNIDLSGVKKFVSASDFLPISLTNRIEKLYNKKLLDLIGQAELGGFYTIIDDENYKKGTIGKPMSGVEIKIDNEGKLFVKTPTNAKEYYMDPDKSKEIFDNGWVMTRDRAHFDNDGYLVFDGRVDNMFKVNSNWISPIEIENVILNYKGIDNVLIRPENDEHDLPMLCADIVVSEEISLPNLRAYMRTVLESYKIPKKFLVVESIATMYNGKKVRPVIKIDN